jgi:hypothetical protein
MTDNGTPPAEALAELAATPAPRVSLDPDDTTPRDMLRARKMHAERDGRDLDEVMDDRIERGATIIWCLRSRDDPSFTYDMALDTPYRDVIGEDEPPPPTAPPTKPGSGSGRSGASAPPGRRSSTTRARPAAPTST